MAEISANCLNCAIGKLFNFTNLMGISMTVYNCNHENKEVVRTKSTFLYLKNFFAVFSLLIISVSIYYAIKRNYEAIKNNLSVHDLLLKSSDITLYFIALLVIMHCIFHQEKINNMFIFFDAISKDFTTRTSCYLLSKDDVLYFRRRTYIILISILSFFSFAAAGLFCTGFDPIWGAIERLGLLLSIFACTMVIIVPLLFMRLTYYSNDKYKRFLRMELENIINNRSSRAYENENCTIVALPRPSVLKLLKGYTDTFIGFNKTFKALNDSCNPIIIILILFIIFFCVIFVFLIIVCIANNTSITVRFLATQFGLQIIIFSTGYTITKFAKINTMNEEELTLLRKFPSSRLNSSENFQFDCFLYVVERYQIKMNASEIMAMEIPLFASILSTILTYVLVAVQFEYL